MYCCRHSLPLWCAPGTACPYSEPDGRWAGRAFRAVSGRWREIQGGPKSRGGRSVGGEHVKNDHTTLTEFPFSTLPCFPTQVFTGAGGVAAVVDFARSSLVFRLINDIGIIPWVVGVDVPGAWAKRCGKCRDRDFPVPNLPIPQCPHLSPPLHGLGPARVPWRLEFFSPVVLLGQARAGLPVAVSLQARNTFGMRMSRGG